MSPSTLNIEQELKAFETLFKNAVRSHVPLLDRILKYIVRTKGKQLRPMFVMLSAKLCGGINESTYRAASVVELLHTATLVHDDVVDEAGERRGFFPFPPSGRTRHRFWWAITCWPKDYFCRFSTRTSEFWKSFPMRFAK